MIEARVGGCATSSISCTHALWLRHWGQLGKCRKPCPRIQARTHVHVHGTKADTKDHAPVHGGLSHSHSKDPSFVLEKACSNVAPSGQTMIKVGVNKSARRRGAKGAKMGHPGWAVTGPCTGDARRAHATGQAGPADAPAAHAVFWLGAALGRLLNRVETRSGARARARMSRGHVMQGGGAAPSSCWRNSNEFGAKPVRPQANHAPPGVTGESVLAVHESAGHVGESVSACARVAAASVQCALHCCAITATQTRDRSTAVHVYPR